MSSLEYARSELERAGLFDKDSDYEGMVGDAVMEIMEKFGDQGHSGYSASMVTNILTRLMRFEPLSPITGADDEWTDISLHGESGIKYQNKRLSSVFKDVNGVVTYSNAITWQGEESYDTFQGSVNDITSSQIIKEFPFSPKKFTVDVKRVYVETEEEAKKHDYYVWDGINEDRTTYKRYYYYEFKDPAQLDEVFEYYDRIGE